MEGKSDFVTPIAPTPEDYLTAELAEKEIGLRDDGIKAILLRESVEKSVITLDEVGEKYGQSVKQILHGLQRIKELYAKAPVVESENFRNLLLSFAEDMRVILIMIADRVSLMRSIKDMPDNEQRRKISEEAAYLYAPLAHKLGLYKLKSELEDLSLKYLEHDAYYMIKDKLNATKAERDKYIDAFIKPIKEKLEAAGLKFHIKGRTKSIHSIWQKMKKQQCGFEGIYDLFAIRVILDSPFEKEKM
ncbi:MAG: bifunctional (p)ppGpp synthetase/guanosine-3',5'-bis(diphosphate) 3'-pyrophosphohydrolase, partial [Prevotella sp.]|nr:bifunctional (p)ppGpp synthetase/guanosine-3',5'-bis(diphosphate) 3'-pyrophosphohydrolase [Prevotella sp.]